MLGKSLDFIIFLRTKLGHVFITKIVSCADMTNLIPPSRTNFFHKTFIYAALCPLFGFMSCLGAIAQAPPPSRTPATQELEQVLEFLAQSTGVSPSVDLLEYYRQNPLRLKTASVRDVQTIPGISLETAIALKRLVKKHPAIDYKALQDSLQLSFAQAYLLKFCTTLEISQNVLQSGLQSEVGEAVSGSPVQARTIASSPSPSNLALWYRARTRFWAAPQRGFTTDATPSQQFQGSPLELYQRLTASLRVDSVGFFEANITAAKDAGELAATDFMSGYLRAEFGTPESNTSMVVGDYLLKSGMGTMLWGMYANKKGADVISPVTETAQNLIPYRSSTEQQFFRGAAVQQNMLVGEKLSARLMAWGSWQQRSARIDSVQNVATSLDFDGLFRTRSEISTRSTLPERIFGVSAEVSSRLDAQMDAQTDTQSENSSRENWSRENWSLGASVFSLQYDKPITSRSVMVFPQQSGALATLFGTYSRENLVLMSEIARDGAGNVGGRVGAELRLKSWEFAAAARAFPTDFRSPFGMNFGENPKPTNEAGLYLAAVWKEVPKLRVNAYLDAYTTFSSTATIPTQVRGVDMFTETTWDVTPTLQAVMRLRHETKTDQLTLGTGRNTRRVVYGRGKTGLRLQGQWKANEALRLQARFEGVFVNFEAYEPAEVGALLFVGASWSPLEWFSLTGRMVAFRTDSFDSAVWQYETAVPGTLSNPPLYGQGLRAYLMLEVQPLPNITLYGRGSLTRRFDVSTLGSGATQINSNIDAQLVLQVDVRF
jgi:hypothetical protein